MDLKIRPAQAGDADFLSWIILTAGRAHVKKGIWEIILGEPEEKCLYFLKQLSITEIPHYFHYTCYLLAETGGMPVAGLGGYDPAVLGSSALWQALPEVLSKFRGKTPKVFVINKPPKILTCIPDSVEDAQQKVGMYELFHAGVEPNKMLFKKFGCWDIGVQCGDWGKVVMEIRMEDRQK